MKNQMVFVYGTLRRGGTLHRYMCNSAFLGEFRLPGFCMVDLGGAPGMTAVRPGDPDGVTGEVYDVSSELIRLLDYVEAEGNIYTRVAVAKDEDHVVWAYTVLPEFAENQPVIAGGDWFLKEQ